MAARLNKRCADSVRDHIKTVLLVKRLQDHALGCLKVNQEMTDSQRDAAKFLISQTMPKPAQTIIQDITTRDATEISDAELADIAADGRNRTTGKAGSKAKPTIVH